MLEIIKTIVHLLLLWLATILTILALLAVCPIFVFSWILCRLIGRDYQLNFKLKANLIEKRSQP
ncbi:hypothetical protein BS064_05240 [Acinetobacter baumannii]|nr:hypothetical protein BS064_05240 [Acinetobacter baumannii]